MKETTAQNRAFAPRNFQWTSSADRHVIYKCPTAQEYNYNLQTTKKEKRDLELNWADVVTQPVKRASVMLAVQFQQFCLTSSTVLMCLGKLQKTVQVPGLLPFKGESDAVPASWDWPRPSYCDHLGNQSTFVHAHFAYNCLSPKQNTQKLS